jgi:endonuclease YncB( thermonuclease family)
VTKTELPANRRSLALLAATLGVVLFAPIASGANRQSIYRIDHVADGDTVVLENGQRVRLVQIDTPEVYFGTECYGREASALTKRLLPPSNWPPVSGSILSVR